MYNTPLPGYILTFGWERVSITQTSLEVFLKNILNTLEDAFLSFMTYTR